MWVGIKFLNTHAMEKLESGLDKKRGNGGRRKNVLTFVFIIVENT